MNSKLQNALQQEADLQQKLKESLQKAQELKRQAAGEIAREVLKEAEGLAAQFRGPLLKRFDKVQELLVELAEADPEYHKTFAQTDPYGIELSDSQKYICHHLIGRGFRPGARFIDFLSRILANKNMEGNPFV